uniref:RNA-directed DNA polymerase, eukaryota n=1 Tax=Tanacetum cinerariifolium TaxID=118510 RepID=A0A6L2KJD4_TANCI|nr:RNA-directed DNA polymerase, eukaryota [Tanacetum cinerariifolium]
MCSYRSKEDDVAKISTSVYVTNFPESISAKELFNSCKVYGHVVDSFKPNKRAKNDTNYKPILLDFKEPWVMDLSMGLNRMWGGYSFARAVKEDESKGEMEAMSQPATYLGEFWVLLEFASKETLKNFQDCVSIGGWFSEIKAASLEFQPVKRIAWVEAEGIPLKLWSVKTFSRIANKWGELLDVDDQEDSCFYSKRLCVHTKLDRSISEDLKIIHRGITYWIRAKETPGWVSDFLDESDEEELEENNENADGVKEQNPDLFRDDSEDEMIPETMFQDDVQGYINMKDGVYEQGVEHSEDPFNIYPILNKVEKLDRNEKLSDSSMNPSSGKEDNSETRKCNKQHMDGGNTSKASGHFKVSEIPRTGGSILGLLDEVVKVGQVMGYKMKGCMTNIALKHNERRRACWGNLAFGYIHSATVGNSGGILCVWDSNSFDKESTTLSGYFIIIRGTWHPTGQKFMLVSVYAPQDAKEKVMLWDYLQHEVVRWKGEVIIMADFNEVRYKSERFGSCFNAQGARSFNSFIEYSGLMEIILCGCQFTWCYKYTNKMSKLDRFLVSKNLLNTCPNISVVTLYRYLSDHRPILLRETYVDYGPIPFKVYHYWFDIEGFNKIVEDAWTNYEGREGNKIRGKGGEDDVSKRMILINKMQRLDELQSKELAQKIKIKWAIEGDKNSSFFHGMLNKKRNSMSARGVMVDGMWVDDPRKVKKQFVDQFSARFSKPNKKCVSIQMDFPKKISDDQLRDLERDVTNEEIKMAVWHCGTEKAPGPDGFTFGFYRRFWYLIHEDVSAAVRYFFLHFDIPKGCNSSFIALIPKIPNPNLINDFRPISLIGSMYKIIAKILANRLVGVLDDIVNETQSAFIANRQILDGPFILNEVLQWCKMKKKQALIFKVDFEKAYDSVRWDFLDEVLRKFGFRDKWCKWIKCCLTSSRGSIIVNGSPTEEFQFGRGLKQGDPLSPLLFILIMESLHLSFQRIVDAAPTGVLRCIESVRSRFLSGHGINSKKATWINWKKALASKERDGLGISSLYAMNRGLLLKWIWRFVTQKKTLWTRVIQAIHGVDGKLGVNTRRRHNSCWTAIVQELSSLSNKGINILQYLWIKAGNGDDTNFWEDNWCEGVCLKIAVASQDLWIWHAFFGIAGANNDINVLDNSPLFDDLLDDLAPSVPYVLHWVKMGPSFLLDKLPEVTGSPRLCAKMKYVFGHSRSEDESLGSLMRSLCSGLRVSLSNKRREMEALLARAQVGAALKTGFMTDMEVEE